MPYSAEEQYVIDELMKRTDHQPLNDKLFVACQDFIQMKYCTDFEVSVNTIKVETVHLYCKCKNDPANQPAFVRMALANPLLEKQQLAEQWLTILKTNPLLDKQTSIGISKMIQVLIKRFKTPRMPTDLFLFDLLVQAYGLNSIKLALDVVYSEVNYGQSAEIEFQSGEDESYKPAKIDDDNDESIY